MGVKDFGYWKKQHESQMLEEFSLHEEGLLWLKLKSIVRKEIIKEFVTENKIKLQATSLNSQFVELYAFLAKDIRHSNRLLNEYIVKKNRSILAGIDTDKLVSELYKLKNFDWGGDYQNSLDKYLITRYVKRLQSYDTLISKFESEISTAVQGYVLNSWYNHWTSILIEHLFMSHKQVLPTVGQIKYVDFFISDIPFDLKVTYLPAEYIKITRRELGFPVELTFLKLKAKELGISFDKKAKHADMQYEINEKLKDKGTDNCLNVLRTLETQRAKVLNVARENPRRLVKWLYENQGEMRFGSENRLFLVLVDTDDFTSSWKLKRNMDLLKPTITNYLDSFNRKEIAELKTTFSYKGKSQEFSALADVIFVIK